MVAMAALFFASVTPAPAQATVAYVAPNFHKRVFDPDAVIMSKLMRKSLCSTLTAAAANFPTDEAGVPYQVKEMALAIALRIDAVNEDAQSTHRALEKNEKPPRLDGFETKVAISQKLRDFAGMLNDSTAVEDEKILSCYLLDIARHLDPSNTEGVAIFQTVSTGLDYPGWSSVLNSAANDGFLFPTVAETNNTGGPKTPTVKPEPSGNPDAALKLKKSTAQMLGFEKSESGALVGTVLTLTLGVDPAISESGLPVRVLFPVPPLGDANPLSKSADSVVKALAKSHAEWPASGQKIVARFEPPYLRQNSTSGELALALALESLYSGEQPVKMPVAIGGVNSMGHVGGVTGLRWRLRYLNKSSDCETLIISSENEDDLLDLLIAGQIDPLLRAQVLKVSTLAEALKLMRGDLTTEEKKAMLDFAEIRNVAIRNGAPEEILRTDIVRSRLTEVVAALPRHVSAALLLRFAKNDIPARLSASGSIDELKVMTMPYARIIDQLEVVTGSAAEGLRGKASARLTALRDKLNMDQVPLADSILDFARNFESYAALNSKNSAKALDQKAAIISTWKKINAEMDSFEKIEQTEKAEGELPDVPGL